MGELDKTLRLVGLYTVKGPGPSRAMNGGGDVYWTDGNVVVGEIVRHAIQHPAPGQNAQQ